MKHYQSLYFHPDSIQNIQEGLLTKMYKILEENNEIQDMIALEWNLKLGGQLKKEDWKTQKKNVHKTPASRFQRGYTWKIYTRFFSTPKIQSKSK